MGNHTATRARGRSSAAGAGGASSVAALHERSARLQREGGLAREVQPGEKLTMLRQYIAPSDPLARLTPDQQWSRDVIRGQGPFGGILHWTPQQQVEYGARMYGEDQLGAHLSGMMANDLRAAARTYGLPSGGTRAELVSRITAHVTEGRYSADFGAHGTGAKHEAAVTRTSTGPTPREREAESRAKAAESRATAAERRAAQLERQLATLQAQHDALKARVEGERVSGGRGAGARPARPSRASADVSAIPRPDSQLRRLDDPTNPVEAWRAFGGTRASLRSVLIDEPAGVLEAMARRAGNPGAKMPRLVQDQAVSRERLANYIAEQMAARFAQ